MCACGTVCQMQWSATPGPHKGLSSLLASSPFTPQTSATRESLAFFRSFLMTLRPLDVSARVRRLSTELWWTSLGHYKYLWVYIDNKLDWTKHSEILYKKRQSCLYFLRRLRSICRTMLKMFYESVVASAILFAVVCCSSRLRIVHANRLNNLIRKARDWLLLRAPLSTTKSFLPVAIKLYNSSLCW